MEAVVGGWVAGYAMALVSTAAGAYVLVHSGSSAKWVPEGVPAGVIGVAVSLGALFAWTIVGLLAAIAYSIGDFDRYPGLGSPSWPFALGASGLGLAGVVPFAALVPRWWWVWLVHGLTFAGLFGWALPWMAAQ